MKLKWGSEQIDNFKMPILVEREGLFSKFSRWLTSEAEVWFMWFTISIEIGAVVYMCYLNYQVHQLLIWLRSL